MKQFQFRLQSVLRIETARLEAERRKLQQLLAEQARLQRELEGLGQERANAGRFLQQRPGGIGALELRALSGFLLGLRARGITLGERIDAIARIISQQRERVLNAERRVRLLANLRDRKFAEWKQELDRELEAAAQEAWNAGHFRTPHLERSVKKTGDRTEETEEVILPRVIAG